MILSTSAFATYPSPLLSKHEYCWVSRCLGAALVIHKRWQAHLIDVVTSGATEP